MLIDYILSELIIIQMFFISTVNLLQNSYSRLLLVCIIEVITAEVLLHFTKGLLENQCDMLMQLQVYVMFRQSQSWITVWYATECAIQLCKGRMIKIA